MCVACGQFKNVVLTESQKEKLAVQFGVAGMDQRIEALSEYMAAKGKKYRDHYAVILTWERKNGRGQQSHKTKDDRTAEAQARLIARMYPENGGSRER